MAHSWHRGLSVDSLDADAGEVTDDEEGSPPTNIPDSPAKEDTRNRQDNSRPDRKAFVTIILGARNTLSGVTLYT